MLADWLPYARLSMAAYRALRFAHPKPNPNASLDPGPDPDSDPDPDPDSDPDSDPDPAAAVTLTLGHTFTLASLNPTQGWADCAAGGRL